MSSTSSFAMFSLIGVLIYFILIAAIIFAIVYFFKLMKERNNYLRDIRDELRDRNL